MVLIFRVGVLPKPKDGSWRILLNTALALGAYSSEISIQNADIYFCQEALRHLSADILQRGSLPLVQALTLLANYLQKRNKPNSGFILLGVAMNMAQAIGLHREFSDSSIGPFTMEIRRRVWWTLFVFDSGSRLTFGRPTLDLAGINIRLPRNLNDQDLSVDLDELPAAKDVPTVTSSLIWQTKLAQLSNITNEKLLQSRLPELSTINDLEERILLWQKNLPPYMRAEFSASGFEMFTAPRMILLWRSMHLRIVMYRPFLLEVIKRRDPIDMSNLCAGYSRCLGAARECVMSIVNFWNSTTARHGSLVWYAFYWLVTATFVPVTCLLYDPQHWEAPDWRRLIEMAQGVIDSFGALEPTALRAAHIINDIVGELSNTTLSWCQQGSKNRQCWLIFSLLTFGFLGLVPTTPDSSTFAMNEPIRMEFAELWNQSWADIVIPEAPSTFDGLI